MKELNGKAKVEWKEMERRHDLVQDMVRLHVVHKNRSERDSANDLGCASIKEPDQPKVLDLHQLKTMISLAFCPV